MRAAARRFLAATIAGLGAAATLGHCAAHPVDAVVLQGANDGGAPEVDAASGPATLIWPNAVSRANSDPWIAAHHDQIAEMQPRVLVLDFANRFTTSTGTAVPAGYDIAQSLEPIVRSHIRAFMIASQYHGYKDPSAPAFLQYQIAKIVDLRDNSGAVNSALLPVSNGSVDYAELGSAAFADEIGIADPDDPSTHLDLCGLFEKGIIHEVWAVTADPESASDPPSIKFAQSAETKQAYDENDVPIPGRLSCTIAPCIDQALPCGVTVRIMDFNPGRGAGCHLFDMGLIWEGYLQGGMLPAFANVARTFFDFDFETRFHAPFPSFYSVCPASSPDAGACISWTSEVHAVSGPASTTPFDLSPMTAGCGNVIFPPNATAAYVQAGDRTVLTSCENYGLHNGDGGADLTTPYSNALAASDYAGNPDVAVDCGGSQPTYLFASMPGLGTTATAADGTPMRNWWVYLFY